MFETGAVNDFTPLNLGYSFFTPQHSTSLSLCKISYEYVNEYMLIDQGCSLMSGGASQVEIARQDFGILCIWGWKHTHTHICLKYVFISFLTIWIPMSKSWQHNKAHVHLYTSLCVNVYGCMHACMCPPGGCHSQRPVWPETLVRPQSFHHHRVPSWHCRCRCAAAGGSETWPPPYL